MSLSYKIFLGLYAATYVALLCGSHVEMGRPDPPADRWWQRIERLFHFLPELSVREMRIIWLYIACAVTGLVTVLPVMLETAVPCGGSSEMFQPVLRWAGVRDCPSPI